MEVVLSDREFESFRRFIRDTAGITLGDSKKALVHSRLAARVRDRGLRSFGEYYDIIAAGRDPAERQAAVDLLTTNETYFFREPDHFDYLEKAILPAQPRGSRLRVWSAACSTGEEPYSIAMLLAHRLGIHGPWDLLASDISQRVLQRAAAGHYPLDRARLLPREYMHRFCLRGQGPQEGTILVDRALRDRVQWFQANLNEPLQDRGAFDVVFLRNVMIYFDADTKRAVVERLARAIRPGGWLLVGHSESLHGLTGAVVPERPAVYRRP